MADLLQQVEVIDCRELPYNVGHADFSHALPRICARTAARPSRRDVCGRQPSSRSALEESATTSGIHSPEEGLWKPAACVPRQFGNQISKLGGLTDTPLPALYMPPG